MITFDIKVDAKYYVLTDDITLNIFKSHLDKGEKEDLYEILKNNKDPRQTQGVDYLANNFKADGQSVVGMVPAVAGVDEWI